MALNQCVAAVAVLYLTQLPIAADGIPERLSLRRLNSIPVLIEKLGPAAETVRVSQDQVRTAVELKLRLAGIKVEWTPRLRQPVNPQLAVG
jgi:hypothetical protein